MEKQSHEGVQPKPLPQVESLFERERTEERQRWQRWHLYLFPLRVIGWAALIFAALCWIPTIYRFHLLADWIFTLVQILAVGCALIPWLRKRKPGF